MLGTNMIEKSR